MRKILLPILSVFFILSCKTTNKGSSLSSGAVGFPKCDSVIKCKAGDRRCVREKRRFLANMRRSKTLGAVAAASVSELNRTKGVNPNTRGAAGRLGLKERSGALVPPEGKTLYDVWQKIVSDRVAEARANPKLYRGETATLMVDGLTEFRGQLLNEVSFGGTQQAERLSSASGQAREASRVLAAVGEYAKAGQMSSMAIALQADAVGAGVKAQDPTTIEMRDLYVEAGEVVAATKRAAAGNQQLTQALTGMEADIAVSRGLVVVEAMAKGEQRAATAHFEALSKSLGGNQSAAAVAVTQAVAIRAAVAQAETALQMTDAKPFDWKPFFKGERLAAIGIKGVTISETAVRPFSGLKAEGIDRQIRSASYAEAVSAVNNAVKSRIGNLPAAYKTMLNPSTGSFQARLQGELLTRLSHPSAVARMRR